MPNEVRTPDEPGSRKAAKDHLLSFKPVGRVIQIDNLDSEFVRMRDACGREVTPEIMAKICHRCGTHLVKMVSPRADGNHAILRIDCGEKNTHMQLVPSVNAADIPLAKVIFRPLEIKDRPPRSVVDHIVNPDDISERVCTAFEAVFGPEVLNVIREMLLKPAPIIQKLAAGEFPIIFIPSPKGGDLQVTPVSPAAAYMGMKDVAAPYLGRQPPGAAPIPRSRWHRQTVSGKPQNISGTIFGPRLRFLACMPSDTSKYDAAIWRYVHGGQFPRWRDPDTAKLVLDYSKALRRALEYSNRNIRESLDRRVDQLILKADAFVAATMNDACQLAEKRNMARDTLKAPRAAGKTLLSLFTNKTEDFDLARWALGSAHFDYRENHHRLREFE